VRQEKGLISQVKHWGLHLVQILLTESI